MTLEDLLDKAELVTEELGLELVYGRSFTYILCDEDGEEIACGSTRNISEELERNLGNSYNETEVKEICFWQEYITARNAERTLEIVAKKTRIGSTLKGRIVDGNRRTIKSIR